ncbi:MAG TPA: uroporphyrinogen-III synthase [Silvibacterium sp.]|nr:uroporphyrinogen-III synthase [Silvibacterium sp.]
MSAGQPLSGRRVLVTRARHQAGRLSKELAKLGAEAIEVPAIEILPPENFEQLDEALLNLRRYEWLIVTSANAVRAIEARRAELKIAAADFAHLKIAAVGGTTARTAEEAGLRISLIAKEYVAESLAAELLETGGGCYLIARAAVAREVIPDALRARGAEVDVVEAYRTVVPRSSVERIAAIFSGELPDAATFTSSGTVTNFFHLLQEAGYKRQPEDLRAISIGPVTSQTLRDFGWEPAAEADPHDVEGLIAATVRVIGD